MESDVTQADQDEPIDWLLNKVMDAIRIKNPSMSGWCDYKAVELNKRDRLQIFFWLSGSLDEDNMKIFAEAFDLTVREIRIARNVLSVVL